MLGYADDSRINNSDKDPAQVEAKLNQDLENSETTFRENDMKPNLEKYQAIVFGNKGRELDIRCGNREIKTTQNITLLGVTINKLKFNIHVGNMCRKFDGQVNGLNRLKNILPIKTKAP